jgi:hypothetical protein
MALTPTSIIDRRREALIAGWRQNPLIVVQVETPAVLPVLTCLDDRGQGAGVGAIDTNLGRHLRSSPTPSGWRGTWRCNGRGRTDHRRRKGRQA